MSKRKYATPAERKAAQGEQARKQMLAQWDKQRQETGDTLGYFGCHRRVRTARGRAADQACVQCAGPARHWAHIHDTDPADPQNYQPMCQKCHWAYDDVAVKGVATRGPEGSRAIALKAWETKRRKGIGSAPDQPHPRAG